MFFYSRHLRKVGYTERMNNNCFVFIQNYIILKNNICFERLITVFTCPLNQGSLFFPCLGLSGLPDWIFFLLLGFLLPYLFSTGL
ncbi:hypothetical protein MCM1_2869 [Methanosarcina barkeri CM1]|uniref:Uncharacterized protein n=2 Tax=Methanosarcina barkeri TaxID=2208 RepID=A0A0G3CGJ5_METBA|nr:hypothetical protein MCM1_2869 [Methanosarcina barkeri CM1]